MRNRKVSSKAMIGELRSLAMISGGMILGTMGGKAIDKMLKVDPTVPGFQVKKLARPVALLGAGVMGSMKLKNQDMKMIAAGIGASGVVSAVKVILKKDLLAGIDGVNGFGEPMSIYQERMIEPYEPSLPALSSSNYHSSGSLSNAFPTGESMGAYQEAEFEII